MENREKYEEKDPTVIPSHCSFVITERSMLVHRYEPNSRLSLLIPPFCPRIQSSLAHCM